MENGAGSKRLDGRLSTRANLHLTMRSSSLAQLFILVTIYIVVGIVVGGCHASTARQEVEPSDALAIQPVSSGSTPTGQTARSSPSTALSHVPLDASSIAADGATAVAVPDSAWVRKYSYSESCGRTAGGTGVVVDHELVVRADGTADLDANGFQTMTRIRATTISQQDRLEIEFRGDGPDNMFTHPWSQGELLLILRRSHGAIVTEWRSYQPSCTPARTGLHFR